MKKILLFLTAILTFLSFQTFAQYPIGHQSLKYIDSSRPDSIITTDIYYPAITAGETTAIATGQFPVIVFGHGFDMGDDAYVYFKDTMTALGYIVVFPTTQSGLSPTHSDFGLDLAYMINQMKLEGANSSSFFYNHVSPQSAVMGHSMGGGCSFLACQNNTVPTCMVTFAEATTTPSSITAAKSVTIPALVLSGSADCIAPPSTNQIPTYDSLASGCKVFLSITGGGHCYFGDANTACSFGETMTSGCTHPLTRPLQHDVILDFVKLYFDYYLKNNSASWTVFNDSLNTSPRVTFLKSCTTTGLPEDNISFNLNICPNPSNNIITANFYFKGSFTLSVIDILGKKVIENITGNSNGSTTQTIDIRSLPKGMYFMELSSENSKTYRKFIKN